MHTERLGVVRRAFPPPLSSIHMKMSVRWELSCHGGMHRQHWLLALQCQADAAEAAGRLKSRAPMAERRSAADRLAAAYRRRCELEACFDAACARTLAAHASAWGAISEA